MISQRRIDLRKHLNPKHKDLFRSSDFELNVRGGANAGKTYSIADKFLLQPIFQPDKRLKGLIVKKTLPSIRNSVIDIMESRAETFNLPFFINKNLMVGNCLGMKYLFLSLNSKEDYTKLKSITDVDFVWVNEISELRESDYEMLRSRIRGGKSSFKQFVVDYNPIGKTSWVFKRFFEKSSNGIRKLKYTIFDNPWASKEEIQWLRETKKYNRNFHQIYFEGEWGELEGIIFNWDIAEGPPENPDEIFYGGDFGFSVNEAALIRIYRKGLEFWVEEIIYERGLTNIEMGNKMREKGIKKDDVSYWDSAEPKSIQELYDLGYNAKPCVKGADSVVAGIDYLQSLDIHIIDGSENVIKEQRSYVRQQDKDGNYLPKPIDFMNHAMSAIRYGIHTHMKTQADAYIGPGHDFFDN